MKAIQNFWKVIRSSFYDPGFYAAAVHTRISRALWPIFLINLLRSFAIAVPLSFILVALMQTDFVSKVGNIYPADLRVTIENGTVTTNQKEPYTIPMPSEGPFKATERDAPRNLVVIDTTRNLTLQDVEDYNALIVVGKNEAYAHQNEGEIRAYNLSAVQKSVVVDKLFVESLVVAASPYIKAGIVVLLPLLTVLIIAGFMGSVMFASIFGALIVMMIAKMRGLSLSFKSSYVTALFASIPVIIWSIASEILSIHSFWAGVLIFVLVVFLNLKQETQTA